MLTVTSRMLSKQLQGNCTQTFFSMALPAYSEPRLLIQFRNNFFTDGSAPWTGDQPVARPLPKHRTTPTQNKCIHTPNIHDLSGIRTHDHSLRASEDSSFLRPRGYCDRLTQTYLVSNKKTISLLWWSYKIYALCAWQVPHFSLHLSVYVRFVWQQYQQLRMVGRLMDNIVTCHLGSQPIQRFVAGQQLRNKQQVL
jgi:hypothetical protein